VSNICPHWIVPELLSDSASAFPQFKTLFGVLHRLTPLFKKCLASFCGQVVPVGAPVTFSEPRQEREAADGIGRFLSRLLPGFRLAAAIRQVFAGLPMIIVAGVHLIGRPGWLSRNARAAGSKFPALKAKATA
jgi:hypothetical protein